MLHFPRVRDTEGATGGSSRVAVDGEYKCSGLCNATGTKWSLQQPDPMWWDGSGKGHALIILLVLVLVCWLQEDVEKAFGKLHGDVVGFPVDTENPVFDNGDDHFTALEIENKMMLGSLVIDFPDGSVCFSFFVHNPVADNFMIVELFARERWQCGERQEDILAYSLLYHGFGCIFERDDFVVFVPLLAFDKKWGEEPVDLHKYPVESVVKLWLVGIEFEYDVSLEAVCPGDFPEEIAVFFFHSLIFCKVRNFLFSGYKKRRMLVRLLIFCFSVKN